MTVRSCTISGNSARRFGGVLADTYVEDAMSRAVFADCTISGNWAEEEIGVAEFCFRVILTNCAIYGNSAKSGGGVVIAGDPRWPTRPLPSLTNCTITGNRASRNAGIDCVVAGSPTLTNCIVWGNTPESVCGELNHCLVDRDPLFVSQGIFDFDRFLFVSFGTVWFTVPDFIVEAPDYRLRAESPAIDAGTCTGAPERDLAGTARPLGPGCDIGAYEFVPPAFLRGDPNADGVVNVGDPICILTNLFGPAESPCKGLAGRCLDATDTNDDGAVNVADAIWLLQYLFGEGPAPPEPFIACGSDETSDGLSCLDYSACDAR
jgi:hypothetical protein